MKYKKVENLNEIKVGDVIRGKSSGVAFVVTANYGTRLTATRTQDVTNPEEWELLIVDSPAESHRQPLWESKP